MQIGLFDVCFYQDDAVITVFVYRWYCMSLKCPLDITMTFSKRICDVYNLLCIGIIGAHH